MKISQKLLEIANLYNVLANDNIDYADSVFMRDLINDVVSSNDVVSTIRKELPEINILEKFNKKGCVVLFSNSDDKKNIHVMKGIAKEKREAELLCFFELLKKIEMNKLTLEQLKQNA